MKKFNNQKGITLVALIITIIVLIILAAVTIISINNMQLVPLAINGTQNYSIAQQEEENLVNGITDLVLGAISNIENGGTGAGRSSSSDEEPEPTTVKEAVEKDHTFKKTTTLTDEYENQVVVPAGFRIVKHDEEGSTTGVKYEYAVGEDGNPTHIPTVQDGIVIEDATSGEKNQFVWIPTGEINNKENDTDMGPTTEIKLGRYKLEEKANVTAEDAIVDGSTVIKVNYQELENSDYGNSPAKSLSTFLTNAKGVNEGGKGGYYIARYEASYDGKGEKPLSQPSEGNTGAHDGISYAPKGAEHIHYLWNNITQGDASAKCQAMYTGDGYESDLVNSYAWDTAIVFIQAYSGKTEYSKQTALNYQEEKQAPDDTGERENGVDKVCNIYDMASNCHELTTEATNYEGIPIGMRGGVYSKADRSSGFRGWLNKLDAWRTCSFRPCLYMTK